MIRSSRCFAAAIVCTMLMSAPSFSAEPDSLWLGSLDLSHLHQSWKNAKADSSMDGRPLQLSGVRYHKGVGTHTRAVMRIALHRTALRFRAIAGINDSASGGTALVRVLGDVAVVTYVRVVQKLDGQGSPVSAAAMETRIWQKTAAGWKHIHFHRAPQ